MAVTPEMLYALETVALAKRQEEEGGRVEDVTIFSRSDNNGQDKE